MGEKRKKCRIFFVIVVVVAVAIVIVVKCRKERKRESTRACMGSRARSRETTEHIHRYTHGRKDGRTRREQVKQFTVYTQTHIHYYR